MPPSLGLDGSESQQGQGQGLDANKAALALSPPVTAVKKEITLPTYLVGLLLARRPAGGARPQNVSNVVEYVPST